MSHKNNSPKRSPYAPWTTESERNRTQSAILGARPGGRQFLRQFADWLEQRGLCQGSITVRIASARAFLDCLTHRSRSASAGFRRLGPTGVEGFFVAYGKDHGPGARRSMQAAMRLVLRYSTDRGWTPANLVEAVPSMRSYRLSGVVRGLNNQEISRLLSSLDDASARDRAILHVLATYGPRRQQISALRMQDIDWRMRSVTFAAHKRGKAVTHTLTALVAESLSTYLCHERPTADTDAVFLRARPPHLPLSPSCVTQSIRQLMAQAGLPPRGPHALRHAFATRLLTAGESVKAIADLLGHRSLSSVGIYAKVDHARLLQVASEWPEVVS